MRRPIRLSIFISIIAFLAFFLALYERSEDIWYVWPIYVMLVSGACVFYILIFKVNESRRRYVAMAVAVTGIFLTHLLKEISYQWGAEIAIAAMIAIVMIGWLYPARG